ncbi:hypothetical protein [Streptomyces sp. SID3343]|uniref:hypothetical protein n=1 Tax=Streptomyces sp. SID3343 TaxID=2690260 RepID=UPI00136FBBFC|nr:hypothetical protein [Streptomyces sp. SID3343]MYW04173.1 hypothetical protein [Streptomyces sp. SID3343]
MAVTESAAVEALLHTAAGAELSQVSECEAGAQERLGAGEDHREAVRAFLARRPPVFRGK